MVDKPHALPAQQIQIWCFQTRMTVGTEVAVAEIVCEHENDIRLLGGASGVHCQKRNKNPKCAKEANTELCHPVFPCTYWWLVSCVIRVRAQGRPARYRRIRKAILHSAPPRETCHCLPRRPAARPGGIESRNRRGTGTNHPVVLGAFACPVDAGGQSDQQHYGLCA